MEILTNIFGNNKKLPFKKTIRFERKESEFEVNIGDEVKIWNKPNTKQLNLYAKGSAGGNGLIGITFNSAISHHLSKTEDLFVENEVVGLTKNSIDLFVNMYADKKAVQEIQQNHKKEWIDNLNKKYNPKTSWELRFYSENKIGKNDFLIKTIDKSQIEEFYQRDNETIWLTDKTGEKLSAENSVRSGGAEKTLRAIFSGHELEIQNFKKEHNWYYIDIGIKK
ncbi:hypothetical protein [Hanstruepera ponticola]|uniref:hypothetical protein n=1 Tax=Hanstruepera ponticola TaxID=2042995 RepID=UPI001785ACA7|nr:hypothetical protein [Hanstruepera ponticola]